MWIIRKVRVKNFRSVIYGEFDPGNISLIVGENDVGKSNYLRALNLFFNNETDVGRRFSFGSDYSMGAATGIGKARQIEISLYIQPPDTFSDKSTIVWRRYWREESQTYVSESFHRIPGRQEIPLKSKAIQWLRRIRFRYVPAIKGNDYFTSLLRDLHDTLAETVDSELRSAASDFIAVVRGHTAGISSHLQASISLESRLQLPDNLRALFEVLDFSTEISGSTISLQYRGDGIKVRHIPAILSFLADQERRLASSGKPRPTAVWGYEEPENNLEMKRAFDHASELYAARDVAQIFITTHSPAFYGLAARDADEVFAFSATPSAEYGTQLHRVDSNGVSAFDESLGLMPVIAPYIAEKVAALQEVKEEFLRLKERVSQVGRPLVVTAGETDERYFKAAIEQFDPTLLSEVDVIRVGANGEFGSFGSGDAKLIGLLEQLNTRPELLTRKAVFCFDCDVRKLPASSHPQILVIKLAKNAENTVTDRGIENMLPNDAFLQEFYRTKEDRLPYGGVKSTTALDKMAMSAGICSNGGVLFAERPRLLALFKPVVAAIRGYLFS